MRDGYFTCAAGDYVVFRVRLSTKSPMLDLTFLTSNLTDVLNGEKESRQIPIRGRKYLLSPGPCGVTVPNLNSPHCFSISTLESNTDSALPIVTQHNTAIIIATVFAAMFFILALGLIVYICIVTRK